MPRGKFDIDMNKSYGFYGVDNNRFKLGRKVFEAIEDPADGYRSYLKTVEVVKQTSDVFFKRALDMVSIVEDERPMDDGYKLVSKRDGHVWFEFGTDNTDDSYPSFYTRYYPRKPSTEAS